LDTTKKTSSDVIIIGKSFSETPSITNSTPLEIAVAFYDFFQS